MGTFTATDFPDENVATDTFAPTDLDIDQWLDACVSAGMTYATLTVKHHDGFALWPTAWHVGANPPRSIAQTTWYANNGSPDVTSLFVTKCREHNLKPCFYFSVWDKTFESEMGGLQTNAEYLVMVKAQLLELLTGYGDITALWMDGWGWHVGEDKVDYLSVYDYVKSLQPNCLLIENNHTHPTNHSDIEVYETDTDGSIPAANAIPAEEADSVRVDGTWFYHAGASQADAAFIDAGTLSALIANANANKANFQLGIGPGTDGHLPTALVTRLGQL